MRMYRSKESFVSKESLYGKGGGGSVGFLKEEQGQIVLQYLVGSRVEGRETTMLAAVFYAPMDVQAETENGANLCTPLNCTFCSVAIRTSVAEQDLKCRLLGLCYNI